MEIKITEDHSNVAIGKFFDAWHKYNNNNERIEFILTEDVIQEMIKAGAIIDNVTLKNLRSFIGYTFYPSGLIIGVDWAMPEEYLILKDQDGKTIKVSEEQYKENKELFDSIIKDDTIIKPSWMKKGT